MTSLTTVTYKNVHKRWTVTTLERHYIYHLYNVRVDPSTFLRFNYSINDHPILVISVIVLLH